VFATEHWESSLKREQLPFNHLSGGRSFMIASYANLGLGIAFLFAILLLGFVTLVWIVAWLRKGFRLRRSGDQDAVRIFALLILLMVVAVMLCFPPLRRTGMWVEPETKSPISKTLATSYDRVFFGYIPTHAWIGRCFTTEVPKTLSNVRIAPHEAYYLAAVGWKVEWSYLLGQLAIALLFAFPFLAARKKRDASSVFIRHG